MTGSRSCASLGWGFKTVFPERPHDLAVTEKLTTAGAIMRLFERFMRDAEAGEAHRHVGADR